MSDDEVFEATDAGAAHCVPLKAGDIKKGTYVLVKGKPCKVS
jgi:translation initiation factor 5A